ncbi:MAG: Maf family protein [Acidobacteriota bacterium]|nr:Maf family protein [Acidobacteriota bacterium]
MPELILASQSPRRRELLTVAGFHFSVRAKPIEEVREDAEDPVLYVRRLARAKAAAAWERPGEIILCADTTVAIDDQVLEKPADKNDASAMLRLLSGRDHTVITGICLMHDRGAIVDHSSTIVRFAPLTDSEIEDYVASGEPMDKAGAYAIQGLASKFVEKIDGCYFNVMGLPLSLFYRHWKMLTAPE